MFLDETLEAQDSGRSNIGCFLERVCQNCRILVKCAVFFYKPDVCSDNSLIMHDVTRLWILQEMLLRSPISIDVSAFQALIREIDMLYDLHAN